MYDVAIVGAGPAGAAAALPLGRCGAKVVLLEQADLPRYKTCGGGVVRRAQDLLPFDLAPVAECKVSAATMNLMESGLSFAVHREGLITMTMRAALDEFLVKR